MEKAKQFIKSEVLPGIALISVTLLAILIANSSLKVGYDKIFYGTKIIGEFNLEMIINDFLMAIFFLYVTLEIKKEVKYGMLSSFKKSSFPIVASLGGVIIPAVIFLIINGKSGFANGLGAVISTDIAFAVGMFMIFKSKLNSGLKVFLLSLAVVDDLISILVILFLYSSKLNYTALIVAGVILALLFALNKVFKVKKTWVYLVIGLGLWFFVHASGIHATISGVFLALAIPSDRTEGQPSIGERLEHKLEPLCNIIILPLFAFANTAIVLNLTNSVPHAGELVIGIICGLVIGKPLGVMLFCYLGTKLHIAEKPSDATWGEILEVAMLTGIGFTMAIFTSELAFSYSHEVVNIAKISILLGTVCSVICTNIMLALKGRSTSKQYAKH